METIQISLTKATLQLKDAKIENPGLEARILLAHILKINFEQLLLNREGILAREQMEAFTALLKERCTHKPIAYLIGDREFYKYKFVINEAVLIPRADSETLIEAVLQDHQDTYAPQILDLGTGSGCLIITLLLELANSYGVAVELEQKAAQLAEYNSQLHQLESRLKIYNQNWCDFDFNSFTGMFDIIIANPPYIKLGDPLVSLETSTYEPHLALFAGEDGLLAYKQLAPLLPVALKPEGTIYLEIGYNQVDEVCEILQTNLKLQHIYYDLANRPRVLKFSKPKM